MDGISPLPSTPLNTSGLTRSQSVLSRHSIMSTSSASSTSTLDSIRSRFSYIRQSFTLGAQIARETPHKISTPLSPSPDSDSDANSARWSSGTASPTSSDAAGVLEERRRALREMTGDDDAAGGVWEMTERKPRRASYVPRNGMSGHMSTTAAANMKGARVKRVTAVEAERKRWIEDVLDRKTAEFRENNGDWVGGKGKGKEKGKGVAVGVREVGSAY